MRRRLARLVGGGIVVGALAVLCALGHVVVAAWGRVTSAQDAPPRPVAIVLGAKADPGRPSAFLAARLDVAVELHRRGSVQRVLLSGDARPASHAEPGVMRRYLEERGVPADAIVEDPAGYDTYDTCLHARETYGVTRALVVTQDYHVRRAVTICRALGVDAVGVEDRTMMTTWPVNWTKGVLREGLANLKMELDLLTRRDPAGGLE